MTDTPHTQKVQVVNLGKPWHHAYKELYSHACEQEKEILIYGVSTRKSI